MTKFLLSGKYKQTALKKINIHILFIDFKQAYNSISRNSCMQGLYCNSGKIYNLVLLTITIKKVYIHLCRELLLKSDHKGLYKLGSYLRHILREPVRYQFTFLAITVVVVQQVVSITSSDKSVYILRNLLHQVLFSEEISYVY